MLYKLSSSIDRLETLQFIDLARAGALEKDLENLLADHLLETLYEGDPLLPFFQERSRQAEPDICALDRDANLVIFELKRAGADRGALGQIFRYVEEASS
jgi:RecB family endonuclease NucS